MSRATVSFLFYNLFVVKFQILLTVKFTQLCCNLVIQEFKGMNLLLSFESMENTFK